MNIKEIRDLIRLIDASGLAEVEIENDGSRLSVKRHAPPPPFASGQLPAMLLPSVQHQGTGAHAASVAQAAGDSSDQSTTSDLAENQVVVASPMVGTFYRSPAPGSAPFVEMGQSVQVGQPVCIIEAMKLMNEIESDSAGRLVEVLVEDAQPVEFGQPLFILERV